MPLESKRDPDFAVRWAAWLARGAAHDRVVRQHLIAVVPAAVTAAVVVYFWFVR